MKRIPRKLKKGLKNAWFKTNKINRKIWDTKEYTNAFNRIGGWITIRGMIAIGMCFGLFFAMILTKDSDD